MSTSTQNRQVQRQVKVYVCDRCRAETTEEAINGWTILVTVEILAVPTLMGGAVNQLTAKPGADLHACPACSLGLRRVMGEQPAPEMVANELANIPIRTNDGLTVMLTRFEYDRWVARGKPPVLSVDDVKAKS